MATPNFDANEVEKRMRGAIDALKREFGGLRTGRASSALLNPVQVNLYGSRVPLSQCATVTTPDARTIAVQVWDKSQIAAVERGIREANLGLNPVIDGALLRLPIPPLTGERRQELVKTAHKYAEAARVGIRNSRRDGMEQLKKLEKEHKISEDEHRKHQAKVQELTDKLIKEIDQVLSGKENEIKQV